MVRRLSLIAVIFLLFFLPATSQDTFTGFEDNPHPGTGLTYAYDGIYKEPRWVSYPGGAIHFNLLGLAETGPVIQAEIQLFKGLYLVPGFRYNYLGIASHQLMNGLEDDSKYLPGSFGASLGIRQFFALQKKNRLVFIGLFGEYSTDKASYNLESQWESERVRNAVNVVTNVGYRWWFRRDLFLHVGIYGGISFELSDESIYQLGAYKGDLEKEYKNSPFVGIIDLSFGWNL